MKTVPLKTIVVLYAVLWLLLAVSPYNRFDWFLENLLIFITILVLVVTYRRFTFSNISYALIALFLSLHTVGAYYSYNTTPLDQLLHHFMHLERDPYDRIVHFSFGLLLVYPSWEYIRRVIRVQSGWVYPLAIAVIMGCAAFYEMIEMWVATLVAPEIGTLFLGTQGDPWDTQHDMEVALYGALITTTIALVAGWRRERVEG